MKKLLLLLSSICFLIINVEAQENCGNGIDDNGDGLIDCFDPACTSNSVPTGTLFNTATNGIGGVLPGGSNDNNWQISTGSIAGPYVPAIVMSSVPGSYYTSPWPDCNWISHNIGGTHSVNTDYYYKIEFLLPCYNSCGASYSDTATFCLTMDFFTDNSVDEVYINGVPQSASLAGVPAASPYFNVGFSAAGGLSFSLCSGWQPGLNVLILKVSSGPGFEGFLAQNSTSASPITNDPTILSPFTNYTVCDSAAVVNFTAASSGGIWTATCGSCINATTGVFDPAIAGPGSYTITYSLTTPCPAADTSLIQVLTLPPNAGINPEPAHCINDLPFNLNSLTSGGIWSGTGITNTSNGTFDPGISGSGTFVITHFFSGTCGDTATQTITVNPLPIPDFTANITSGCAPLCVQFNELVGTSCTSVSYNFGDGNTSSISSPNHCYTQDSIYSVSIECTDLNGCTGITNIPNMITVYPIPEANFSISPSTLVYPNTLVNFTNTSTGGSNYSWIFDDPTSGANNFSISTSPSHIYPNEGEYCILLIASNAGGCSDSVKYCIIVEGESTIFIPNIFTPNGDLSNDVFMVSSSHMKEITYSIYDRWGLEMAEINGLNTGWNGETKNGKIAPDGTYFFVLKAKTNNGKTVEKEGYIQLLSK
jgi:gliding motility-associated-like protein